MVQRYLMPALKKAYDKSDQIPLPPAHVRIAADPSGRKHQVHSIAVGALVPNSDVECIFSFDESGQSRVGLSVEKDDFSANRANW